MDFLTSSTTYALLFVSLYFEVFLLVTYFESKLLMQEEDEKSLKKIKKYPEVSIIVPCWNEKKTISKTIDSLLNLNYPKDKLHILIVDDGSTDNTWEVIKKFESKQQVKIYHKENGGKHDALNFALEKVTTELVGCLDADSYVDKEALRNIVVYFENKETMSVIPSVQIWKPKNILQMMQKVEYQWNILKTKMFSYIDAVYVTPGPFSIFRRQVFTNLGGYKFAHQTEDLELAIRMQSNHYKIVNAHNALVYTVAPETIQKLYKQRLRWTYGFFKNSIDYKHLIFNKKYGNLGLFVLPMVTLFTFSTIYVTTISLFGLGYKIIDLYTKIQTVGLSLPSINFDIFYIHTGVIAIASLISLFCTILIILLSKKMTSEKINIGMDVMYFLILYFFITPIWTMKALYNTIFSIKTGWR